MENEYLSKVSNWWGNLHYSSLQKRGLAIIALLVLVITALFVMRGSSQEVIAAPAPLEIESSAMQTLMVDVAGAVINPGVYSLPLNARVFEAIKAAGGLKKGADTSDINQARILRDGEQIYVYPTTTSAGGVSRPAVRKNGPIMINRATVKDFESLDGIGPVLANRIVSYRKINGPFAAGDIEPPVQSVLRSRVGKVDIYKVAHHGSRYQDLDLIRELSPALAVISVGEGNSYGHPAASTISALTDLHAKVLRTDIDGAVAIRAERHHLSIQRSKRWLRFFFWS